MNTTHVMLVLLYSSVAGTCKENSFPILLIVISGLSSCSSVDPLTSQLIEPAVVLQLKVAVDPRVAFTDVGVLVKAGI